MPKTIGKTWEETPWNLREWEGPGWSVVCRACQGQVTPPLTSRHCPHCGETFSPQCQQHTPQPWTPSQAIQLARMAMPEIVSILGSLKVRVKPGSDTMSISSKLVLYVGQEAMKGEHWNVRQAAGVILHECFHLLRRFHIRARRYGIVPPDGTQLSLQGHLDQSLLNEAWNLGGDAEINHALWQYLQRSHAPAQLPPEGVFPESLDEPPDLTTEHYFQAALRLLRNSRDAKLDTLKQRDSGASGDSGDSGDSGGTDPQCPADDPESNDSGDTPDSSEADSDSEAGDSEAGEGQEEGEGQGDSDSPGDAGVAGDAVAPPGDATQAARATGTQSEPNLDAGDHYTQEEIDAMEQMQSDLANVRPWGGSSADGIPRDYEDPEDHGEAPELSQGLVPQDTVAGQVICQAARSLSQSGRGDTGALCQMLGFRDARKVRVSGLHKLRTLLRKTVRSAVWGKDRRTFARPGRLSRQGMPMPSHRSDSPKVTLIIDTSYSMTERNRLSLAASCIKVIREMFRDQSGIRVITGDTQGRSIHLKVRHARQILQDMAGGGGTDMGQIMRQAIQENKPDVLVVATDLETPWPEQREMEGVPVVIASCNGITYCYHEIPTWATLVHVEDELAMA